MYISTSTTVHSPFFFGARTGPGPLLGAGAPAEPLRPVCSRSFDHSLSYVPDLVGPQQKKGEKPPARTARLSRDASFCPDPQLVPPQVFLVAALRNLRAARRRAGRRWYLLQSPVAAKKCGPPPSPEIAALVAGCSKINGHRRRRW